MPAIPRTQCRPPGASLLPVHKEARGQCAPPSRHCGAWVGAMKKEQQTPLPSRPRNCFLSCISQQPLTHLFFLSLLSSWLGPHVTRAGLGKAAHRGQPCWACREPWRGCACVSGLSRGLARAFAIFVRVHSSLTGASVLLLLRFGSNTSGLWGHQVPLVHTVVWEDGSFFLQALSLSSWQLKRHEG